MDDHRHPAEAGDRKAPARTGWRLALFGLVALVALLLLFQDDLPRSAGILWVLPLLIGCVALHALMHGRGGGHGGHGGQGGGAPRPDAARPADRDADRTP